MLPRTICCNYKISYNHELADLLCSWKSLKFLEFGFGQEDEKEFGSGFRKIIHEISIHCPNLVHLSVGSACIDEHSATTIATLLPNIEYLDLSYGHIQLDDLKIILQGCLQLSNLDVSHCIGFDENDAQILDLTSHIATIKCEGSYLYDNVDDDYFRINVGDADDGFGYAFYMDYLGL